LLSTLPRLAAVGKSIELQDRNFDGSGETGNDLAGEAIPLASRILRAAVDFDFHTAQGLTHRDALSALTQQANVYDPKVLAALKELFHVGETTQIVELNVDEICVGMILQHAVGTTDGRTLLAGGSEVTETMLNRLRAFARNGNVVEPILVSRQISKAPVAALSLHSPTTECAVSH
jgi:hypothetical protein